MKGGGRMNKTLLKAEMVKANVTRDALCAHLGVSYSTLTQKINGKRQFTVDEAVKICQFLQIDDPVPIFFDSAVPNMQHA
jgi:plasmid maintenance system antidote protein VapI